MAKPTQTFTLFPWPGGLVTSVDEGLLQPGELTQGDNIVFDYQHAKRRREGINFDWDDAVFVAGMRSSSGTTRTLIGDFAGAGIQVGDVLSFSGSPETAYNGTFREVLSVDDYSRSTAADNIDLEYSEVVIPEEHSFSNNDWVRYQVSGTPIGGLTPGRAYYVILSSGDSFQLAEEPGGTAIVFESAGSGTHSFNRTVLTYMGATALEETATDETAIYLSNKVVGGVDYWFGNEDTRAQYLITVLDNGVVYRTSSGQRVRLIDGGRPWTLGTSGLTEANLKVYNNSVFIAVSGLNNQMKYWTGDISLPLRDVQAALSVASVSRESDGLERTLVFDSAPDLEDGDTIVVRGHEDYEGTFIIKSGGGTDTIVYDADSFLTENTTNDDAISIGTFAPLALFIEEHQGRLVCNDKYNLDRLHYSGVYNQFLWGGIGDSGAVDIGIGDGDPAGLTGIAPTFKGALFVGKRTKLYRIQGDDIEKAAIIKQSNGIGFLSHQAITAIDQDDVFFVSYRGVHSLTATDAYGDFASNYLSTKIQRSFVETWSEPRKRFIKAAYLPEANSVVFGVTEAGETFNNNLWLYNIPLQYWYRWPGIGCETVITAQDSDRRRLYLGTLTGRLARTQTREPEDIMEDGVRRAVSGRFSTGLMFLDGRPDTIKAFKRVMLVYRGQGSYTITCKIKIDNFSEQALAFISNETTPPLGYGPNGEQGFILGQDVLGGSYAIAPYSLPIDGYGRGIRVTVEQTDLNTALAIQGLLIEYEVGGDSPETRLGDNS